MHPVMFIGIRPGTGAIIPPGGGPGAPYSGTSIMVIIITGIIIIMVTTGPAISIGITAGMIFITMEGGQGQWL